MNNSNMKAAPDLSNAGQRLTVDYMKRFIADPATTHHHTTMPDMLGGIDQTQRVAVAADMAAYLSSLKSEPAPLLPEGDIDPHDGKELFHSIGCVACHSPRNEARQEILKDGVISLNHLSGKHHKAALGEFLHAPLTVRPSGRMPEMKLTKMEAHSLAAYLEGENTTTPDPSAMPSQIAAGRKAFQAHNCTACHQPEAQALTVKLVA
jgi:mono/diheme cytochrome c family protein